MASFVESNFIPVRVHVRNDAADFKRLGARYSAQWTPTILIVDSEGDERHRVEGFLPAEDLLAQLTLGLGHAQFARGQYLDAERWYREVIANSSASESAPEALYWAGVSKYKATNDAAALADTAAHLESRYPATSWAKKASVWAKPASV